MKEFCKDFMGNDLKIGDYIAVSDKTYSKTPYIIYGQITNIEYEFLVQEISSAIKKLLEDDNIDCAYLTGYQNCNSEGSKLNIVVLLNPGVDYYHYDRLIEQINKEINDNNNTNIIMDFTCDYAHRYSIVALNPSEVHRVESLVLSSIIFDKSGRTTNVRNTMKKYSNLYPFNLVEYIPPIDEPIISQLRKK